MGYYRQKIEAFSIIDAMFGQGKSDNEIVYRVQSMYGFSDGVIRKRLALLRGLKVGKNGQK